jgi:hypothetical protein
MSNTKQKSVIVFKARMIIIKQSISFSFVVNFLRGYRRVRLFFPLFFLITHFIHIYHHDKSRLFHSYMLRDNKIQLATKIALCYWNKEEEEDF